MARCIELTPNKTYATRENAIKAVEKIIPVGKMLDQMYFIHMHTDGRFFPVFVGERAIQNMLHFKFNVVA